MSDRNEQNEYYQYYGSFPYKSYDQILAEKRRKRRYKRGLFGMLVLFCFLALALVSISVLVGRREEAAEEDARRAETAQPGNAQVQTPSAGSTDDFSLSEGGAQTQSGVVYRDVSKI